MSSEGQSGYTKYKNILTTLYFATIASVAIYMLLSGHKTLSTVVLPEFEVETASVYPLRFEPLTSPLNVTLGYFVTGEWLLFFNVRNPNKDYVLAFSDMNVAIEYSWLGLIWDGYRILGFNQTEKSGWNSVLAAPNFSEKPRTFPFVVDDDRFGMFSKYIADPGWRSKGFKVGVRGMVVQRKAGGGSGSGKEEAAAEKWRELKVECNLKNVAFEVEAAGVMAVAATPSVCRLSVD